MELENWVNSIHNACAAAFARHRGKTGTLHLLQEEIYRLERAIESVRFFNWNVFLNCFQFKIVTENFKEGFVASLIF